MMETEDRDGPLLILGATGLLGQQLMTVARRSGRRPIGVARQGADLNVDLSQDRSLDALLRTYRPSLVINSSALVSLDGCEKDPAEAYRLNARLPGLLAGYSLMDGFRLVQISTDHYYSGDGSVLHREDASLRLLNEYARTKYAGECFSLTAPGALVIRTNIAGFRGWSQRPSFLEWLIGQMEDENVFDLFNDYFTSTLPASSLATLLFELLDVGATGVINVACREAVSKLHFAQALASELGFSLKNARTSSVRGLVPQRAESLGLDVTRAEFFLKHPLPTLAQVMTTFAAEYRSMRSLS